MGLDAREECVEGNVVVDVLVEWLLIVIVQYSSV